MGHPGDTLEIPRASHPPRSSRYHRIRHRTWKVLSLHEGADRLALIVNRGLVAVIVVSVLDAIVGTVSEVRMAYGEVLDWIEVASVTLFLLEYVARLWSTVEDAAFARPLVGRLRWAMTPMALIDLIAIVPFFIPAAPADLRVLRLLRLLRILRLAKLTRYHESLRLMVAVIWSRRGELLTTVAFMVVLLVIAGSLVFFAEHEAQPDKFPDIPAALWWATVTLTTVGYGDIYPITTAGKLLASVILILGIGVVALPAGVLASGFMEVLQERNRRNKVCPHCGRELH